MQWDIQTVTKILLAFYNTIIIIIILKVFSTRLTPNTAMKMVVFQPVSRYILIY